MDLKRLFFVAVLFCLAVMNFSCDKESATLDEEIYSIKKSDIDDEDDT